VSAETRAALEHLLADPSADATVAWQRGSYAADMVIAARAHLASERSEAMEALERVRENLLFAFGVLSAEDRYADRTLAPDAASIIGVWIDAEITRLREGTG
jgi:hypothetical protein